MTEYYMNQKITNRQDLLDGLALITMLGSGIDSETGEDITAYVNVIVPHGKITKVCIKPSEEIKLLERQLSNKRVASNQKSYKEQDEIRIKTKQLKDELLKWEGMAEALRFLDPEYEWAVSWDYYSYKINKTSELRTDNDDNKLAAMIISKNDHKYFHTQLAEYGDGSGQRKYKVKFFKTETEAKDFVTEEVTNKIKNGSNCPLSVIKKLNLKSAIIDKYVKEYEDRAKIDTQNRIHILEKTLAKEKEQL